MKTWRIEITRTATRQITKLDRTAQKSIQQFLRQRLTPADNPRQWGRALQGEKRGLWRYRVGDYRLICDITRRKDHDLGARVGAPQRRLSLILGLMWGRPASAVRAAKLHHFPAQFSRLIVESKAYPDLLRFLWLRKTTRKAPP